MDKAITTIIELIALNHWIETLNLVYWSYNNVPINKNILGRRTYSKNMYPQQ